MQLVRKISTWPILAKPAILHKVAIIDAAGEHTFSMLFDKICEYERKFSNFPHPLKRVSFALTGSFEYVALNLAIWKAGLCAVPLNPKYPPAELEYFIKDSQSSMFIHSEQSCPIANLDMPKFSMEEFSSLDAYSKENTCNFNLDKDAMIIYTSGTTGKPKGVVHTFNSIESQIKMLVSAWKWTQNDRILHILPLHHIHGIINALHCAIYAGASIKFLPNASTNDIWVNLTLDKQISVFMAVPTTFVRLLDHWNSLADNDKSKLNFNHLRLVVSGSAALMPKHFDAWKELTSCVPLERYGMSEIGMALSNPIEKEMRTAGSVGYPLPGVSVKLASNDGEEPQEILVKSDSVFKEYFGRPKETKDSFTDDGWFKTGDFAIKDDEGRFFIKGRSYEIIKTGGYKVSALEIESTILTHPCIKECAVIGVPNPVWGEEIVAVIVASEPIHLDDLKNWCKKRMAAHKIPKRIVKHATPLPRNSMGKLDKKALRIKISA